MMNKEEEEKNLFYSKAYCLNTLTDEKHVVIFKAGLEYYSIEEDDYISVFDRFNNRHVFSKKENDTNYFYKAFSRYAADVIRQRKYNEQIFDFFKKNVSSDYHYASFKDHNLKKHKGVVEEMPSGIYFVSEEGERILLTDYDYNNVQFEYKSSTIEALEEFEEIKGLSEFINRKYDFVNPPHYKKLSVEVIDMMIAIWGPERTMYHCEMSAFKYRLRLGEKPDQPIERDLDKARWYENKASELRELISK